MHPEDVEAALNAQPGVQASAVVPLLTTAGTEPVAVLLFRGSQEQAQQAVVAANGQLAEYQQIHLWRLWPDLDLPRTSTGKVRRPKVTEWVNTQRAEAGEGTAADPLLAMILSISHASAGTAGDDARLSEDLGLDSLGRVQLQSELEQKLGLILDDVALERVVTLGDLRRALGLGPRGDGSRRIRGGAIRWPRCAVPARPAEARDEPRRQGEEDIYPHWPWWWPVRLLRDAYLELVSQPFVWFLGNPRVERPAQICSRKARS